MYVSSDTFGVKYEIPILTHPLVKKISDKFKKSNNGSKKDTEKKKDSNSQRNWAQGLSKSLTGVAIGAMGVGLIYSAVNAFSQGSMLHRQNLQPQLVN